MDLNYIEILSNWTAPNRTLEKLKLNMVVKGLKRGTTFCIGTSSDSKWVLN
jgi:hypothetical protein